MKEKHAENAPPEAKQAHDEKLRTGEVPNVIGGAVNEANGSATAASYGARYDGSNDLFHDLNFDAIAQ